MHIGKAIHLKICEVHGKMKNEDSRGFRRRYIWRNYVPKFEHILHISKHLKRRRNIHFQHQRHSHAPKHSKWSDSKMNLYFLQEFLKKHDAAWLVLTSTTLVAAVLPLAEIQGIPALFPTSSQKN
ncbi:transmembrane protein, putative [Medicago truncatula]|uniref:Transmembrane protein, putative n=1 Tax=Medicago truncatula TaxID=3880 RepID=G7K8T0_MEDTR|nr:transmembrane protein, putative [Medicago truncatula]